MAQGCPTQGPNRWFAQLDAPGAEASLRREMGAGAAGSIAACKLCVTKPAQEVTGLHRLQLFQPVVWDELLALSSGSDRDRDVAIPLAMRFSIKSSIDLEIGCTLNSGTATRNWTTNRNVSAGQWTRLNIPIEGDPRAPWEAGPGGFGLYFQIGLSCGATRLSTLNSVWNDGHYLMLENATSATFLTTEGATAWLTACSLAPAGSAEAITGEAPALARLRTQRYDEKSYPVGVRPGTPNAQEGAFQIRAHDGPVEDQVTFKVQKSSTPSGSISKVFSPVSGAEGCAFDVSEGRDVPAHIGEVACTHMVVVIPDSVPGHVYRYHWLASIMR